MKKLISLLPILFLMISCSNDGNSENILENGEVEEYYEVDGKIHGPYNRFSANGELLYSVNMFEGMKDGDAITYFLNGGKKNIDRYKMDTLVYFEMYHENGVIEAFGEMNGTKKNGIYYQFSENSDTLVVGNFKNDRMFYRKVTGLGGELVDIYFDYDLSIKEIQGDSLMFTFEIPTPDSNIYAGLVIGDFSEVDSSANGLKGIILDTAAYVRTKGNRIVWKTPKERYRNKRLSAHLIEFDNNNALFTKSIYDKLDFLFQDK